MSDTGVKRIYSGVAVIGASILLTRLGGGGRMAALQDAGAFATVLGLLWAALTMSTGIREPWRQLRRLSGGAAQGDPKDYEALLAGLRAIQRSATLALVLLPLMGMIYTVTDLTNPTRLGHGIQYGYVGFVYACVLMVLAYGVRGFVDSRLRWEAVHEPQGVSPLVPRIAPLADREAPTDPERHRAPQMLSEPLEAHAPPGPSSAGSGGRRRQDVVRLFLCVVVVIVAFASIMAAREGGSFWTLKHWIATGGAALVVAALVAVTYSAADQSYRWLKGLVRRRLQRNGGDADAAASLVLVTASVLVTQTSLYLVGSLGSSDHGSVVPKASMLVVFCVVAVSVTCLFALLRALRAGWTLRRRA